MSYLSHLTSYIYAIALLSALLPHECLDHSTAYGGAGAHFEYCPGNSNGDGRRTKHKEELRVMYQNAAYAWDHTSEATSSPPLESKEGSLVLSTMDSSEGDWFLPLRTDALRVVIVAENFLPKLDGSTITLAHLLQHLHSIGIRAMLLGPEIGMASYAGPALLGLLVHAYTAPFHLTLCGHGRASHAPRIRRRPLLQRLSTSPLRRAPRPRHIHQPAHGQVP
ncbi:hypothetical protein K438DRAFT_1984991 [Mycena galopus ATCC 62051]|nr:hypothetical protein K438DRAFT_1984991 [Mycena galopus ATCC 62051]